MLWKKKRLDLLLPENNLDKSTQALATYWKLFRAQYPDHEIFDKLTEEQLRLTVPVKVHGDEGRSVSC